MHVHLAGLERGVRRHVQHRVTHRTGPRCRVQCERPEGRGTDGENRQHDGRSPCDDQREREPRATLTELLRLTGGGAAPAARSIMCEP